MSNVFDLADFRRQRETAGCVERFQKIGLTDSDLSIIACAAARAFAPQTPTFEEIKKIGFQSLRYLEIGKTYEEDATIFHIGRDGQYQVTIGRGYYRQGIQWHDSDLKSECFNLSNEEDPGTFAALQALDFHRSFGNESISVYGEMAMNMFYFAGNSNYHCLHMQLNRELKTAGMLMYDPIAKCDVVLLGHTDKWGPTQQDLEFDRRKGSQ